MMRDRKTIETEFLYQLTTLDGFKKLTGQNQLILEVLLDIRDLLKKQEMKR